mmetsp:Transcript_22746/g.56206  ORF Transcript_22746/g.56206 Transcript_22746/m.56206 type:complete len:377 (-) Transcript_22746:250-1380(-)|eukprot:CAMPEP_0113631936 /NCGR_PEP_ID=MMETSP0017_2-20120614/16598_1 /TAXON_ID=2856 /ORGANISM="Cylindrotheca closterium" /LENGTH=376 /DNA_ID=CAMNT_0000542469 /DNA_START=136 /DNA_END=1266 /DNA_ORIENTATION=+ /assembly_acc=CAM_ASM_000147
MTQSLMKGITKSNAISFFLGWLAAQVLSIGGLAVVRTSSSSISQASVQTRSLGALEHSNEHHTFSYAGKHGKSCTTDTVTPFHRYMMEMGRPSRHEHNFTDLPLQDSWLHYFEAYHNHMARFRGKENVVFMEIGVQSGGKIPILRKYFGPGLTYIGLDINPSTKMFETKEDDDFTVHIEIGDSGNPEFLNYIKEKYPHVDIFLDDGGHTMSQQRHSLEHMLPHVQPEGVFMCEDLGTSWSSSFGGVPEGHVGKFDFVSKTMVGLIHQTMGWFVAAAYQGGGGPNTVMRPVHRLKDDTFDLNPESPNGGWWRTIPTQVKHIHYYNQIVAYEKGVTYQAESWRTIGHMIPYKKSGEHEPVNWKSVIQRLDEIFGEGLL